MSRHVLAALTLTLAAACVAPEDPSSGDHPDASKAPDGNNATCIPAATPPGDGHHNAGLNCLGCHTGAGAPLWTAAGTMYNSAGGPVAGATITLVDATNKTITLVSAQNGNFWTTTPLSMPLTVKASKCPSSIQMSSKAQASCNSCHTASGNPGRIKMP